MATDVTFSTTASPNSRTNVRKPESAARDAFHAAAWPLRALARVSATLAGRAAARVFFTTLRPPVRPEEAAILAAAERFTVPFGRGRLPAWALGDGPTVVLSHGWNGRAAQLAPLAAALATAGFRAVVFDHPAHGEAAGTSTTVPEMAQALAEVDAAVGGAHAVVTHSIGGVVATLALARTIRPKRVVFIAPPVDPRLWQRVFARRLGLGDAVDAPMLRAIEARAGVPVDALDPRRLAPALTQPALIVHDRGDREVPFAAGEALAQAWGGPVALVPTEGLGHTRILRSPEVGERVLAFLAPLVAAHAPRD